MLVTTGGSDLLTLVNTLQLWCSCVAENRANRRISAPARLTVTRAGWAGWGDWGECSAHCGPGQQRRLRECRGVAGGGVCSGEPAQTRPCSSPCRGRSDCSAGSAVLLQVRPSGASGPAGPPAVKTAPSSASGVAGGAGGARGGAGRCGAAGADSARAGSDRTVSLALLVLPYSALQPARSSLLTSLS